MLFARELTKNQNNCMLPAGRGAWLVSMKITGAGEFAPVMSAPDMQADDDEAEALRVLNTA